MKVNSKVKWITETAVMLALLIGLQLATKSLGQFVTGSFVNLILALTTLLLGLSSGLTLAIISPFLAFIIGIGPAFIAMVPGVCLGNAVLVVILWLIIKRQGSACKIWIEILGGLAAVVAKFLALFLVVTKLIVPLLGLPDAKAAAISTSFTWPQLITAAIGTAVALLVWPLLTKALKNVL